MASVNDLAERVAKLETTVELGFKHLAERLDSLALELSDQGRTPAKVSGAFRIPTPSTIMEYTKAIGLLATILTGVWGVAYSGAQSGGNAGAATAVETAVETAEAIPVAPPPTIRVVPYPLPVPVPIPAPVEDPPIPDDLLPDPR